MIRWLTQGLPRWFRLLIQTINAKEITLDRPMSPKLIQNPFGFSRRGVSLKFMPKVLGLESHTFDIRKAKYVAKCKKTVDEIANYTQREYKYKYGANIAMAIKALSLPTLQGTQRQRPGRPLSIPVMYKSSNRTLPR